MVSKRKIKNEIKKAFRLPSNAVVMSMMAVILVCAAPALVSIIDDSYTYEGSSEIQVLDIPSTRNSLIRITNSGSGNIADTSYIPASENDGIFVIALNDPTEVSDVLYARFAGIDMASITSDTRGFKVVTSSDVTSVRIELQNDEGNKILHFIRSEVDPSVWTISPSSVDLLKIRSGVYDHMFVDLMGQAEVFDMQIFVIDDYMIPYGEIIIGATGVLLLICALLATPWVSTSGLTVKRRR